MREHEGRALRLRRTVQLQDHLPLRDGPRLRRDEIAVALNSRPATTKDAHMTSTFWLISGAVFGALFVLIAYAIQSQTRRILFGGLVVAALAYVIFPVYGRASAGWIGLELLGLAIYGGIAFLGLRGSQWWLVAGWALHPVWDIALHYLGAGAAFAPAPYALGCLAWDPIVAAYIAYRIVRPAKTMTPALATSLEAQLVAAKAAAACGDLDHAWRSLERAHVLSQFHAGPHVRVHCAMVAFAWRRRDFSELLGQVPRLILAAPGSWTGRAPRGNTGGSDVGIFTPMEIPQDLSALLAVAGEER